MLRVALILAAIILTPACGDRSGTQADSDAIQALVDGLASDRNGDWANGAYPYLDLPPYATVEKVIDELFQTVSFREGRVTEFTVLELRGVVIGTQPGERYNAAMVETNLGRKIVLFRREEQDWWTRVYDVAPSA